MFKDPQPHCVQYRLKGRLNNVSFALVHPSPTKVDITVSNGIKPLFSMHSLSLSHCALIVTVLIGQGLALGALGLKL